MQRHGQVINVPRDLAKGLSKMTEMAVISFKLRKDYIPPVSYKKTIKRQKLVLKYAFNRSGNH